MRADFLIIGGGVAGLSAANRLAERGADVTLLEAGSYPAHKICGEFISPEALPILEKWGIMPATSISAVQFILPKKSWSMPLPEAATTLSRYVLDEALARRAEKKGAHIQTGAQVERLELPKSVGQPFVVTLSSGERWVAPSLLLSTGRIASGLKGKKTPKFCYVGAKAHFEGIDLSNELMMYLMKGAYFGVAPIGSARVNVAGIIACTPEEAKDPKATLSAFFEREDSKRLKELLGNGRCLFEDWLTGAVPEFGIRECPRWSNTFCIGDAAGVIPPATGNGLAMGITSGILAAEHALKGEPGAYRICWHQTYAKRIARGRLLHRLFLSPWFAHAIPLVGRLFPSLPQYFFRTTRG